MVLYSLLASTSSSAAVTASDVRKRDSLLSVQTENGAGPGATLAVACDDSFPDNLVQWLHELKPVTKDIATSHNGAGSCRGNRQFDYQFDYLSHMQFHRQNHRRAGLT
jgi:hypothetical protein